jgi:hypothetical protein
MLSASKKIVLPDISNPGLITAHQDKLFISDGTTVFIFSLKDFKPIKQFGRTGNGPGEFAKSSKPWVPSIFIYACDEHLVINSRGKTSLFSTSGDFIKETKTQFGGLVPIGEKYVGFGQSFKDNSLYIDYNIVSNDFQEEKTFFKIKAPRQRGHKVNPLIMANPSAFFQRQSTKGFLFLPTFDGVIHVFDAAGTERFTIKPDYPKVPVTEAVEKTYMDFFKNDHRFKRIYEINVKNKRIQFPKHLPLLKTDRISDGKLYLITNSKKKKKYETLVYNLKGKLLGKTLLPLKEKDLLDVYPFTIHKGKLYQIIENQDEDWELHVSSIN